MTSKFSDILTDPKSGIDVWCRWLWDGGTAYIVTRRDEHHECPACEGARTPPEYEEPCPVCGGSGEVEALYGQDDDLNDKLLWPRDAEEASEGYDNQ